MSSLSVFSWFGANKSWGNDELPDIFPLSIAKSDFVKTDVINIYTKILTDVIERTQGIPEDAESSLWDSCLASEASLGLISLLAEAMESKGELFLVYKLGVIRKATEEEKRQIEEDYKKMNSSSVGVYISFKNYSRTDMVKLYSALEFCTIQALNKSLNLSKAIQLKMSDMRGSVSLSNVADAKAQAVAIAEGMAKGYDVMLDAKDVIETAKPDIASIESGMAFIDNKRSFYLGMPKSYINGDQTAGIGSTGEADTKAVERGLKNYYESIIRPVLSALFGINTEFKSQDFRMVSSGLEAVKTFSLIEGSPLISDEEKRMIVSKLFDLDNS